MMIDRAEREALHAATLDELLPRWHRWGSSYKASQQTPKDPIFRNAKSSRGWDSISDIVEDEVEGDQMETIDFEVSEMPDIDQTAPYRSAIYSLARNLAAGCSVWVHPRLPKDALARATIVAEARNMLTKRLAAAGVM